MSRLVVVLIACIVSAGCAARPKSNPSFALSSREATAALDQMRDAPKPLARPLVILGGFADVGLGPALMHRKLGSAFDEPNVLRIVFNDCASLEACRAKVVRLVDERFGKADGGATVPVDVVGLSMGGLVGLYASSDFGDGARRLDVRRLFTMSSPLTGARLAALPLVGFTRMNRQMRAGSPLYAALDKLDPQCEVFSYTRLDDPIVGARFAALPGRAPWWLPNRPFESAHWHGVVDDRALADVARRLRGEAPFAADPAAPLPASELR